MGLKWVLQELDSHWADALAVGAEPLLVPDFWLNEACNVLWLQVRKGIFTPEEAREGFALLQAQVVPTPTAALDLHKIALDIGLAVGHSPYDTLYLAFAIAMGARSLMVADGPFVRAMQHHPDPALAALLIPLDAWAREQGIDDQRGMCRAPVHPDGQGAAC